MKKRIASVIISVLFTVTLTACGLTANGSTTKAGENAIVRNTVDSSSSQNLEDGTVETASGLIKGTQENGIYSFLGIPYAEATKRFVPAEDVTPWDGVFEATSYGAMSPQGSVLGMTGSSDESGTDNNCQNLNIWTPGVNDDARRPVMVWLHGGGFSTGTANEDTTNGRNLSEKGDVVVVSVNHRLNVYGFLDLSAYGDEYKHSANVGLTDIVKSLEWIQENIEQFGGDPNNVTLFGQSGGGAKVLSMMTSPYAKGLFEKGIVQSGATETMGVTFSTQEESTYLTQQILNALGITSDNIEELQNVSNSDLQDAASKGLQNTAEKFSIPGAFGQGYGMEWGPVIDGDYMPSAPVTDSGFADAGNEISLLIGSNLNEWTTIMRDTAHSDMTDDEQNAFVAAYPDHNIREARNVDTFIRLPLLKIMRHKVAQNGASVYSYLYTYSDSIMGSYHGAEIPFIFRNQERGESEQTMADIMSMSWVNFAKTGVPGTDDMPKWEPYDLDDGATMILNENPELKDNHDKELMELMNPSYMNDIENLKTVND